MAEELLITGLGLTSAYGSGVDTFWRGLVRGDRRLAPWPEVPEAVVGRAPAGPGPAPRRSRLFRSVLGEASAPYRRAWPGARRSAGTAATAARSPTRAWR